MASNEWLVRKLHEQDKKIEALSRGGTGVGHSSIAPGENLTVISDNGEVVLGAGGVEHVDGPTPATPSAPTLKLGFGTIETTWDGTFAEGEDEDGVPLTAPVDFDAVEVHCSTDPEEEEWGEDTRRGQIKTREGGTVTVGGFDVDDEVFVCLIALAKTGKRSAPSATASLIIEGLDFAQLTNELNAATVTIDNAREVLLDGQNTLGEKLDAADTALSDLETTLGELDSTTLPALRTDLDAAEGRLSTAEGQITDAFGQIVDVRSDAATDATSKADAAEQNAKSAAQQYDTALKGQIDSTINQAKADLTSDIDAVRTSANGKNTVTWSTSSPPASYSGAVNDTWFVMSGAGSGATVQSQWRWNGNVWVSTKLSQAVLAQIDIGTGTFGSLDGARLKVGSIYADSIVSGLSQNMVPDPGFASATINNYRVSSANSYGAIISVADGVLKIDCTPGITAASNVSLAATSDLYAWPVYPAMKVRASVSARGVGSFRLNIRYKKRDGSTVYTTMTPTTYTPLTSTFTEYAYQSDMPQDATGFSIVIQVHSSSTGLCEFRSPFAASAVGATVIEDGAVTTGKLAANVLEVGNLKAGTAAIAEAVVQKIAASTASIQQADVKNLFVTGTSSLSDVVAERIAAETAEFIQLEVGNLVAGTGTMDTATINKLFSDVVVASMAQAQEFIGENAILTGAVTAPKITASEELWAKIAEFVQIRAEHIEADALDSMVITGATIRSAATGARTLMSASGFEAYNTANERTFFADASTGEVSMIGKLFTGKSGFSRVAIDPSLWASLPVYDGAGGIAGYASGAGVRVGVDASSSADFYHAALSNGTTSGVFRSSSGKSVVSVEDMPLSGGRSLSSVEIFGEVSEGKTYASFGSGLYTTYTDKADSSYRSELSLYKNSSRLKTNSGSDSSSVTAGSGFARISAESNGNESYSSVSAGSGSVDIFSSYDPRGNTASVSLVNGTSSTNGYVNIAAEHINPLRVNYLGTGDSWIIPFSKSGTSWGYIGSSGAMGVDEFGIQSASGKSLRLQDSSGANIQVTTAGGEPLIISTTIGNKTYSGSANMYVSGGGGLGKIGSSLRYKTDVENADDSASVLDVQPRTWVDIGETNIWEKAQAEQERIGEGPLPKEFSQVVEPRRYYGAIAEEVHDLGLTHLVGYDEYGRPDTLNYDRFAIALIPEVRKLRDRITELERLTNE